MGGVAELDDDAGEIEIDEIGELCTSESRSEA